MTIASLLILTTQQPALLTHDFGVLPVSTLFKEARAKLGWPLKQTPSVADQLVYCNVKDMTQEEFMSSMTKTLGGSWVKSGDEFLLRKSPLPRGSGGARKDVLDAFFKSQPGYSELTQEQAVDYLNDADGLYKGTKTSQEFASVTERLERGAWGVRGLTAFAHILGRRFFEDLKQGERVVFSTSPTPRQRPFPQQALPIVKGFWREIDLYKKALKQLNSAGTPAYNQYTIAFQDLNFGAGAPAPEPWTDVDVVVTNVFGAPSLKIQPRLTQAPLPSGGTGGTLNMSDALNWGQSAAAAAQPAQPLKKPPFEELGTPIELSDQQMRTLAEFAKGARSELIAAAGAPLTQALLQPERGDILHVLFDEPFDKLAAKRGRGLVALVPDRIVTLANSRNPITPAAIGRIYGRSTNLEDLPGSPNSCLVSSEFLLGESRANRRHLSELAKSALGQADLLDALASYSLSDPSWREVMAAGWLLAGVGRPDMVEALYSGREILRIYGRLGVQERLAARKGGCTLNSLPPAGGIRSEVEGLIFGKGLSVAAGDRIPEMQSTDESSDFVDPFRYFRYSSPPSDWNSEPTRLLAAGIPADARLRIQVKSGDVWFSKMSSPQESIFKPTPLDLNSLASSVAMAEKFPDQARYFPLPDGFQKGRTTQVVISFTTPSGASTYATTSFNELGRTAWITLGQVPPDFREALDKEMVKARENYKNVTIGGSGSVRPPE